MSKSLYNKKIFYKIYTSTGSFITDDWDDVDFQSFSKKINGGFGECIIKLARPFDDFGEDDDVRLNNRVEIYVYDINIDTSSESQNDFTGKRIYSGYISRYSPWIDAGGNQGVTVHLLGYHTKLAVDVLKNGAQTKLYTKATDGLTITSGSLAAADGGEVMRAILKRYTAESSNVAIHYNKGTIVNTSSNLKYTFDAETYLAAIERVRQMSPAGYYWFIDSDNLFYFKSKPSTITHKLYFQKHFNNLVVNKNMERIVNTVLLDDGLAITNYRGYSRTLSQGEYGRRILQKSERYFSDTATMDKEAVNILDTMKEPDIEIQLTLLDSNRYDGGYDIESIEVGDTVKIEGFKDSVIFEEGMIIKEFIYKIDRMDIIIQPVRVGMFDKILTMKRIQDINVSEGKAASYTAV